MQLGIFYNKKRKIYYLRPKENNLDNNRLFLDICFMENKYIKKYRCYLKNGKVFSFDLDNIQKLKDYMNSVIFLKKMNGEL